MAKEFNKKVLSVSCSCIDVLKYKGKLYYYYYFFSPARFVRVQQEQLVKYQQRPPDKRLLTDSRCSSSGRAPLLAWDTWAHLGGREARLTRSNTWNVLDVLQQAGVKGAPPGKALKRLAAERLAAVVSGSQGSRPRHEVRRVKPDLGCLKVTAAAASPRSLNESGEGKLAPLSEGALQGAPQSGSGRLLEGDGGGTPVSADKLDPRH